MEDVGAEELDERDELTSADREFWLVDFGENVDVALAAMDGVFPNALPPNAVPPNVDPEGFSLVSVNDDPGVGNAELELVVALNVVVGVDWNPDAGENALGTEELNTEPVGPAELKVEPV